MNINFAMWKTAIWTLVKMDKKEEWEVIIDGGVVEVLHNHVILLADGITEVEEGKD